MNTHRHSDQKAINSLRTRTADFFKMELSRAVTRSATGDRKPLRRSISSVREKDFFVSNENMCAAMWQLMQRC